MAKQRNPKGSGTYYKLPNGKYEWRRKTNGKVQTVRATTPIELKAKVKRIENFPGVSEKLLTDAWFTQWLENYIRPLRKVATYQQYSNLYRKHIKPGIGNIRLSTIKSSDIQKIIIGMNDKSLSTWTMKHVRKICHIALQKAFKEQHIAVNPVTDIEIPNKQPKTRKTLTPDELNKLFSALSNSRWIWSARFMLVTGLRRGELLALQWTDIDVDNSRIVVSKSNSEGGIGDTKSAKVHYVPLSNVAIQILSRQKAMLEAEFNESLYNPDKNNKLIFPSQDGVLLHPHGYYTIFKRASDKVGIYASPHCLRHTFVYLTREGLSLKDLQFILGHDESTTTLDIYGDMINQNNKLIADKIDDIFKDVDIKMEESRKVKLRVI